MKNHPFHVKYRFNLLSYNFMNSQWLQVSHGMYGMSVFTANDAIENGSSKSASFCNLQSAIWSVGGSNTILCTGLNRLSGN